MIGFLARVASRFRALAHWPVAGAALAEEQSALRLGFRCPSAAACIIWLFAITPPLLYGFRLATFTTEASAVDWQSYRFGVERLVAGLTPYSELQLAGSYRYDQAGAGLGFVYPPSGAVVLAPFLQPLGLFLFCNVALFAAGIVAVARPGGPLFTTAALWFAVGVDPFADAIRGGAVTPALAGMLGLIYVGIPLAGLGGAVKIFPLAWAALPARDGFWRAAGTTSLGLAVPVLISVALAGLRPWQDAVVALSNAQPACGHAPISLVCDGVPSVALLVTGLGLAVLALWLPRPIALLTVGFVPIVAASNVWEHYWLTVVPGLIAIAAALTVRVARHQPIP